MLQMEQQQQQQQQQHQGQATWDLPVGGSPYSSEIRVQMFGFALN